MAWTKERIAKLQKMWEKGLSASQIAEELGEVTRNAVIGKAHRLGLSGRPSPVKSAKKAAQKPKPAAKKPPKETKAKVITLLMLTDRICKWPIGHPDEATFHFCGIESAPGHPYCAEHAGMAYQERSSRKDRRDRSTAIRN